MTLLATAVFFCTGIKLTTHLNKITINICHILVHVAAFVLEVHFTLILKIHIFKIHSISVTLLRVLDTK
jgi:hypothetical protein